MVQGIFTISASYIRVVRSTTKGSLVLVKPEVCHPSQWHLVRIIQKYSGEDGLVKTVTLITANSTLDRRLLNWYLCLLILRRISSLPYRGEQDVAGKPINLNYWQSRHCDNNSIFSHSPPWEISLINTCVSYKFYKFFINSCFMEF